MSRSIIKFAAIILVIAALFYVGLFGLDFTDDIRFPGIMDEDGITPVSYTHLDVYKRQQYHTAAEHPIMQSFFLSKKPFFLQSTFAAIRTGIKFPSPAKIGFADAHNKIRFLSISAMEWSPE